MCLKLRRSLGSLNYSALADRLVREQTITESSEIAEELNLHFASVGEKLDSEIPSSNCEPESYLEATKTTFSLKGPPVSVVRELLAKLNERKAAGLYRKLILNIGFI